MAGKFGLYNMNGVYLGVNSNSLERIEKVASTYSYDVQIGETYKARSPWNPKRMTDHVNLFKVVKNGREDKRNKKLVTS